MSRAAEDTSGPSITIGIRLLMPYLKQLMRYGAECLRRLSRRMPSSIRE